MRRHSPSRSIRHPPARRRGRGRSLSPLSRSQPAPPGEESGRKLAPWDVQNSRNKRPRSRSRSRSRSREWVDKAREQLDRQPPFIRADNGRPKRRELPRDRIPRNRDLEKSRERNRERDDRPLHLPRDIEEKGKPFRRHSPERILHQIDDFEESYLDNQPNHFGNNSGLQKTHNNIMEPSSITFNAFVPEQTTQDKGRGMERDIRHQSPRNHHRVQKDIHKQPPRDINPSTRGNNREAAHHKKEESAADRINRLEKLVEKLVEGNVNSDKPSGSGYHQSKDIIPELIPSNPKFTTSMWLNCIHEECLNKNYDEKSSIRFVQDKMTGIMKAWFKTVSNYDFTWPELKMLITKTFPDNIEFAQTLKLLVLRDKAAEETITQYYFSKLYLCEACKVTGENTVSCLIDGLSNPFMKQDIKSFNFLTPEALYSEYLCKFPESELPMHMDRREVREVVAEYRNDEFIPLELDNKQDHHREYHREELVENKLPGQFYDRKKCFTCRKFGHATVDCRHAPICYKCKKKGHIAAKCHFNNLLLISSATLPFTIPKIRCSINGREYFSIIDTGCDTVIIQKKVTDYLKLDVGPTYKVLKGYGDKNVVPLGETKMLLTVGSTQRFVTALIVENNIQHVPVIIGQEFLSQDGVFFSQENGQVTIFDSKDKEI